jgi:Flp pilus assembly protein TadD
MRRILAVAVSVILAGWPALTRADDKSDCGSSKDESLRIKACSALIQHDPKDAGAYFKRGAAYQAKGDMDNAIADFSKAIELKPNDGHAYENRGRAYASKGDYTHAVADVSRAGELTPKTASANKTTTSAAAKTSAQARAKTAAPAPKATAATKQSASSSWPDWAPKPN